MRRVVIFTTPISLLLAVAGVSAARDKFFDPGQPEATVPEATMPERTFEQPREATTKAELPDGTEAIRAEDPDNDGKYDGGRADESRPSDPEDDGRGNGRDEERGGGEIANEREGGEEPGGEKVTVCHEGKTISVGAPAEPAHLKHGDHSGPC